MVQYTMLLFSLISPMQLLRKKNEIMSGSFSRKNLRKQTERPGYRTHPDAVTAGRHGGASALPLRSWHGTGNETEHCRVVAAALPLTGPLGHGLGVATSHLWWVSLLCSYRGHSQ